MAYAVIAVPTGIVTAEFSKGHKRKAAKKITTQLCSFCLKHGHDPDADFCKFCGEHLHLADLSAKEEAKKAKNNKA